MSVFKTKIIILGCYLLNTNLTIPNSYIIHDFMPTIITSQVIYMLYTYNISG